VDFIASVHGEQRRRERDVTKRDLQAAVKYGKKERTYGHQGKPSWKYTFADVVYITDDSSKHEITSWAVSLPLEKAFLDENLH